MDAQKAHGAANKKFAEYHVGMPQNKDPFAMLAPLLGAQAVSG